MNRIYIAIFLALAILALPVIVKADIVRDCGAVNTTAPADYLRISFCVDDRHECPQFTTPLGVPVTQGIAVACTINGSGEVIYYQIDPSPASTPTPAPTPTAVPHPDPVPYPGPSSLEPPATGLYTRVFIPFVR